MEAAPPRARARTSEMPMSNAAVVGIVMGSTSDWDTLSHAARLLQQFEVPAADILNAKHSDRFERLMRFQAERAHRYYDEAFALLPAQDRRAQRAGLIMAAIYRALLHEIERDGFRVLQHRISLTPLRKLWIAWKTWVRG